MKRFGLIGFPLKNTFSVNYFTEKFESLNLDDHIYENFPIENIEEIISLVENKTDLIGLNITVPHKVSVIKYLDELDESAKVVGAVNCVKIVRFNQSTDNNHNASVNNKNFKLIGFNTDVFGFKKSLETFLGEEKHFDNALILGTGGASKAVAYILEKLNIDFKFVTRNNKLQTLNTKQLSYEMLDEEIIHQYQLIINSTPIGMFPNINEAPLLPYQFITPKHFAFDLIYHPNETLFLKNFREHEAKTKNGLEMLHLQADKAWEIFQ